VACDANCASCSLAGVDIFSISDVILTQFKSLLYDKLVLYSSKYVIKYSSKYVIK